MRSLHKMKCPGTLFGRAKNRALLRLALSWTDGYVEPDIPAPTPTDDNLAPITKGYTFHDEWVYPATCGLYKRTIFTPKKTIVKRTNLALYSDYMTALKALRATLELDYAKRLLAIDTEIFKLNNELYKECEVEDADLES